MAPLKTVTSSLDCTLPELSPHHMARAVRSVFSAVHNKLVVIPHPRLSLSPSPSPSPYLPRSHSQAHGRHSPQPPAILKQHFQTFHEFAQFSGSNLRGISGVTLRFRYCRPRVVIVRFVIRVHHRLKKVVKESLCWRGPCCDCLCAEMDCPLGHLVAVNIDVYGGRVGVDTCVRYTTHTHVYIIHKKHHPPCAAGGGVCVRLAAEIYF